MSLNFLFFFSSSSTQRPRAFSEHSQSIFRGVSEEFLRNIASIFKVARHFPLAVSDRFQGSGFLTFALHFSSGNSPRRS